MNFRVDSPSGDLSALVTILRDEGHTVISGGDLAVRATIKDSVLQTTFLGAMGIPLVEKKPTHFIGRWFQDGQFGEQILLGIPLPTLMNEDLGAELPSGLGMRFISESPQSVQFTNSVRAFVEAMNYVGWVTFQMNQGDVVGLETGMPGYGWYNVLEYIKGSIGEWLAEPKPLLEYWTVGVLVTRSPFPEKARQQVRMNTKASYHLNVFEAQDVRDVRYATTSRLFYSTGWDRTIQRAAELAYAPANDLDLSGKQYRTDALRYIRNRYAEIKQYV